MPSVGPACRNTASEASDNEYQALFPSHHQICLQLYIPVPQALLPSIQEFPPLAHSFHIVFHWLLFLPRPLPPTPPCSDSFLGPLALASPPLLTHNFQTFSLLLGQKRARFVLGAFFAQALGPATLPPHSQTRTPTPHPRFLCTHIHMPMYTCTQAHQDPAVYYGYLVN
jgi:hypothetical protein